RIAAYEMLVVTSAIGNLIRENKTFRITSAIQTGQKLGMVLMDDSLFNLWRSGKCSIEEVLLKAQNPDDLGMRIAKAQRGISDEQLAKRLVEQFGMKMIYLGELQIPAQVLDKVTEAMAQLYRVIPVAFENNVLTIATCDPQKLSIEAELRTFLGYDIRTQVAIE